MMSPRGRGQRVREVLAAADQHVAGERGGGRAAPLQVAGVHVDLVGEAGVEVADLRPADHQRVARSSSGRRVIISVFDAWVGSARSRRRAFGADGRGGEAARVEDRRCPSPSSGSSRRGTCRRPRSAARGS